MWIVVARRADGSEPSRIHRGRHLADVLRRMHAQLQRPMREWSKEDDEFLRQNYRRSMSARDIGAKLGATKNQVIGRAGALGLRRSK